MVRLRETRERSQPVGKEQRVQLASGPGGLRCQRGEEDFGSPELLDLGAREKGLGISVEQMRMHG